MKKEKFMQLREIELDSVKNQCGIYSEINSKLIKIMNWNNKNIVKIVANK